MAEGADAGEEFEEGFLGDILRDGGVAAVAEGDGNRRTVFVEFEERAEGVGVAAAACLDQFLVGFFSSTMARIGSAVCSLVTCSWVGRRLGKFLPGLF